MSDVRARHMHGQPLDRRQLRVLRTRWETRNKNALLACILPVMIIAKCMVAFFLPDKYFYDNNRILGMVNATLGLQDSSGMQEWEGSYRVASDLFASLNFPRLSTMLDWSLCLGVLLTALAAVLIMHADAPDLLQSLFILATVGLLNIYIFTIGKDVIQFAFFFGVYLVLILPINSSTLKILLSAGVLYYESTFFREYYILIAALVLAVYAVLQFFRCRSELHVGSVLLIVVILLGLIYIMLAVASRIMPDEYDQVLSLRAGYDEAFDGNTDSSTFIQNWVAGEGLPIFMVNYVINAFRMMIPIELAMRGAYYLPFFVFQTLVTFYLVNLLRQINRIKDPVLFLALCVFLGYVLASFIFEPDFGSWTRHEAATFPVLLLLVLNRYQRVPLTSREHEFAKE
ncbi:hypothetical protein BLEM_1546 [Bifidobacterium lemurum]|uniref:Uncharacterized protein n=1 Tax=Bifidobacterium lemurum TaxID=1603886 RepID=A0A261FQ97_9BIFI|nr:hypothetical protein [Bifidobacterium lemurum]OZG61334.1 hypothetical protein BLEM_1546 [Bifidobacterium lemurum]QOL34722.1 hypothetical protein BL8807_02015 [Bifidobacterium lemurum]